MATIRSGELIHALQFARRILEGPHQGADDEIRLLARQIISRDDACEAAATHIDALEKRVGELEAERDAARAKAIEECARVADKRAAICADAVAKIRAGKLYKETATTSVMTENCARLEAVHIAELIRDLNGGAKP